MKIIPVIDILNGIAVHAVKGKRSEYKPLQSNLIKSTDPQEIAEVLYELGFKELYIADIDAIIDCSSNFDQLKQIVEKINVALMVDAGVTSLERAYQLLETGVAKIVVGTETLSSKNFIVDMLKRFGRDRILVSLDLKDGKVLVQPSFSGPVEPIQLLKEFKSLGLSEVIVLDLSRVGSREGVDFDFLKKIIEETGFDIYIGGGVRDLKDLNDLKKIGVVGVLIGTSLHTGKISIEELKGEGFF